MTDIMFYCSTLVIVGIVLILFRIYERWGECRHNWGNWVQNETEYAYVQQRICTKCGFAETHQFKKFRDKEQKCENSSVG